MAAQINRLSVRSIKQAISDTSSFGLGGARGVQLISILARIVRRHWCLCMDVLRISQWVMNEEEIFRKRSFFESATGFLIWSSLANRTTKCHLLVEICHPLRSWEEGVVD